MSKKTLAYVVYPGISLLELVANRTLLAGIMARRALLKLHAGYEVVVVGERIEEISTDTPMAIIPQKTFADVPQPDALVVIGGGAETLLALDNADLIDVLMFRLDANRKHGRLNQAMLQAFFTDSLDGVHQDVAAFAFDQPDHHRNVELARWIGACNQTGYRKVTDCRITDRIDFVLRSGGRPLRECHGTGQET